MARTRLHFHHAVYQWWGVPSRYVQLVQHIDPDRFACTTHGAPDVADPGSFPEWQRQLLGLVEPDLRRQHQPWYNANDLAAEAATHDVCRDGKVDLVHFLDGEHSGPWLPQMIRNRLPAVRTVATFHQPPALAEEVIHGPALRHLDAVILMAPSQLPFFSRFVPQDRLHVILHGVDTAFFRPPARSIRRDRLHCITTGLHLRDWEAFHAVAKALPEMRFTVVTSDRVTLEPLPNVQVLSGLSDEALADAYRAADVLFLPLKDATANNSLLEGMATGLPVVSTDLAAVRAYVPDAAGLLIPGNAVQPLVSALTRLAQDQDLRDSMGAVARQQAERLSWTKVAKEYEAIYAALLASPRPNDTPCVAAPLPPVRQPLKAIDPPSPGRPVWPPTDAASFTALANWADHLRDAGLTDEAGMIVAGLVATQPAWPATEAALASAAEADWRWPDAAGHWAQFLQSCPADQRGRGLARRAHALAQAGAIAAAKLLLETGTGSFETWLATARIASDFAAPEKALSAWQACTDHYPDRIEGFLGLARHHLLLARFGPAESLLDHIRQVWPDSAEAAALWAQSADDRGKSAQARDRWRDVMASHGWQRVLVLSHARHLGLMADTAACTALLANAEADESTRIEILLQFHSAAGDWSQAAQQARRAIQLRPDDLFLRQRYCDLLLRFGTAPAMAEALEGLRVLSRHSATTVLPSLARALIANRREDEASALIATFPAERDDQTAGLLRLWQRLWTDGDSAGLSHWQAMILGFGFAAPVHI